MMPHPKSNLSSNLRQLAEIHAYIQINGTISLISSPEYCLNVLRSDPNPLHRANAPWRIPAFHSVGFKRVKTVMNCSIDSGSVLPKATANGL